MSLSANGYSVQTEIRSGSFRKVSYSPGGVQHFLRTLGPRLLRPKFFHTGSSETIRPNQFRPAWDIEGYRRVMESEKERGRRGTRERAARSHQGPNHWHVERRSSVLICQPCGERIPAYLRPQYCPNCGAGA